MSATDANAVHLRERLRAFSGPGLLGRVARVPVGATRHRIVHRENKATVLRYDTGAKPRSGPAVLLVPSLINRHYIFDLLPGKSIAEQLCAQGFVVTAVDWGAPADEDRLLTLDDVVGRTLRHAVAAAAREAGGGPVVLAGYCLGGTLAALYAARFPADVAAFIALTTPIDFDDDGLLGAWARTRTLDPGLLVEALGNVPWPLLQAAFHLLRPTLLLNKMKGILERLHDDAFLDGVLALEIWGNDNVAFPGACWRTLIDDVYRGNRVLRGDLTIAGRPADLRDLACPVLSVVAEHDTIVPRRSSRALVDLLGPERAAEWVLPGGHIGAVVSRRAMDQLWPAVGASIRGLGR